MTSPRAPLDRSAAVTGLLTVVAANFLYLAGLPTILDPMMAMEPFYIDMAHSPVASILSEDPAWGPLYALWLKPFRAVLDDPIAVYTANVYGLSLGVSILIYVYLLLLTRRAAVGVGAALFFLISDFNVPLSSKVSDFALMVVVASLTVSELVPAGARRTTVAAVGTLLASYARPEIYPAALFLCLAALWLARREVSEPGRSALVWPTVALVVFLLAVVWSGTPVFSPYHDSDRLLAAFREHFAWNWTRWHDQGRYFLSIWEEEFGGAQTILAALWNNPRAVMHHLIDNLIGTMRFLVGAAYGHYPLLVPATDARLVDAENIMVSTVIFGSLILATVRARWRRQMVERYGHVLLPYAAIATCSLVAATAIFPRAYYLVLPGVMLMLVGALAVTLIVPASTSSWRIYPLAALVCLAAIPKPFVLPSAYVVPGSPFKGRMTVTRTVTDTVEFIRTLGLPPPVHVLTLTDGMGEMLGTGFHEIKVWQKGTEPLEAYMRQNHVDLIVTLEPGQNSFVVDDPYWKLVQKSPAAAGFTGLSVPGHEAVRIFVRTDLVRK